MLRFADKLFIYELDLSQAYLSNNIFQRAFIEARNFDIYYAIAAIF